MRRPAGAVVVQKKEKPFKAKHGLLCITVNSGRDRQPGAPPGLFPPSKDRASAAPGCLELALRQRPHTAAMSELRFIVDALNQAPFNMGLTMVRPPAPLLAAPAARCGPNARYPPRYCLRLRSMRRPTSI